LTPTGGGHHLLYTIGHSTYKSSTSSKELLIVISALTILQSSTIAMVPHVEAKMTWRAYFACAFAAFGGILFGEEYDSTCLFYVLTHHRL
jgi:hypothetical protein